MTAREISAEQPEPTIHVSVGEDYRDIREAVRRVCGTAVLFVES